jgi:molybdate transport system substrate-binding protein
VTGSRTLRLFAAGSLEAPLTEMARAFEVAHADGIKVETQFGASGLLRERIEKGEAAHVFASADVGHPSTLADAGCAVAPPSIFARNELCAIARPGLGITSANLLDTLLAPAIRVATSTPKADPSGDYAFALFAKAEAVRAGARVTLEAKALQLTGGATSQKAPPGRNQYAWVMASGRADLFLTYATNAMAARQENPSLEVVEIPAELEVSAAYALVVLRNAPAAATALARFILGPEGQAILGRHGFGRAGDPES